MTRHIQMCVVAGVMLAIAGCAASARQRPVGVGDVNGGEGSVQAERAKLQGRWSLDSLNVRNESGRQAKVDAVGTMAFDGFGNLEIEYRFTDDGQRTLEALGIKTPDKVVSTAGSAAIDPVKKLITYAGSDVQARALGFDPDLAARRANPFTLERVRYYAFGAAGVLTLTTRHADGTDAATAQWKKVS
jgi:hypothetical protein